MRRSRLSLFYLSGYLSLTGLGLMFAPGTILPLLLSNRDYGDIFPRFAGVLMLALGLLVSQIIRHRIDQLYPASVAIRSIILAFVLWLYFDSGDPLFLVIFGVVGLGVIFTGTSYLLDRRAQSGSR